MARLPVVLCLVLYLAAGRAQRFGDRLAPRVPTLYSGQAAARPADNEILDYEEETVTEEPAPLPPPRAPSRTEAHRLEMSTDYFVVPERSTRPPPPPSPPPSTAPPPPSPRSPPSPAEGTVTSVPPPTGALRTDPWAVPVLALACVWMIAFAGFEAFTTYGARRGAPVRRRPFLGRTLVFGLFSCAALAAVLAAAPTPFACGVARFGVGVSYALVLASLLVECAVLLSANGGTHLPATYQALLLFFAVLIQVAVGAQRVSTSNGPACRAPLADTLPSLAYDALLIALSATLALRARGAAKRAGAAAGAAGVAWLCRAASVLGAPEHHRDACAAAGLLATSAAVFAIMFAPKTLRSSSGAKAAHYDAEREEGLSSLGRAGSGYSPSFFHFKPVKYGIVTASQPAPPPTPPERKEPPPQPSDRFGDFSFASPSHFFARQYFPPRYYPPAPPPHSPLHYHYPHTHASYHCYWPSPGVVLRSEDGNVYTTLEPTFSSNPNVYFQRTEGQNGVHPGMMY